MHTAHSHYISRVADRDVTMLADKIGAAHRQTGAINLKKPTRFRSFVRSLVCSFQTSVAMRQQLTGTYSAELNCLYLFLGGKSDDSLFFHVCFSKLQLEMAMVSCSQKAPFQGCFRIMSKQQFLKKVKSDPNSHM